MSDWQPIETAPKDGTEVLLFGDFDDEHRTFLGWYDDRFSSQRGDGPFGPFVWCQFEGSMVAERCVTHWQPLPEPPVVVK